MMKNDFIIVRDIFNNGINERIYSWEKDDVAIIFCPISSSGPDHPQYRGANKNLFPRVPVLIDLDDLEIVRESASQLWRITISKFSVYATSGWGKMTPDSPSQKLSMHRVIAQPPGKLVTDHHFHHYGLDNRRGNLLNVTIRENSLNRVFRIDPQDLIIPEVDLIIKDKSAKEAVQVLRLFNKQM